MGGRTCVLLLLVTLARGGYTSSPAVPGYTAPAVNSPPPTLYTPTGPAPAAYTTAVVHGPASTSGTPSVSTATSHTQGPLSTSAHSVDTPYSSSSKSDIRVNNDYHPLPSYAEESYPTLNQQYSPYFLSQYYKRPPFAFARPQQSWFPSPFFHPAPNSQPHFYPNHPYFHSANFQVPNPISLLNRFTPPNAFQATFNPLSRGPLPSPGYYSPNNPPQRPLFSVGYSTPETPSLPYN